ncbi:hypothetical protein R50072_08110 [Simiduia litorea]
MLRVDGRDYSRQALREKIEGAADAVPTPDTKVAGVAAVDRPTGELHGIDATTRLRALVLSAFTGRPVTLAGEARVADAEAQPGEAFGREQRLVQGAAPTGVANDAIGEPVQRSLVALNVDRAVLVIDEREASLVAFSIDLTLDGNRVAGALRVQQSRTQHIEVSASAASIEKFLDPLVLNFNGPLALAEGSVQFDLDGDGHMDLLPNLVSDSYLLAWDKNANGHIDDGAEVVGALSGNGYADLRALDDNGDGFLSAADAGFQQLRLWRPSAQGIGLALDARAVQAIFIGSIDSPFTLQAERGGAVLGRVRQSSFFVADNRVQLSQQVDFRV